MERKTKYLEPDQVHAIIEGIAHVSKRPARDTLFVELLWQSGARVNEATQLKPEHIGKSSVVIKNLKQTKRVKIDGKSSRVHDDKATKEVEISEDLCSRLKAYCTENEIYDGQWVFPSNRTNSKPMSRWYAWDVLTRASEYVHVNVFGKKHPATGGRFKGAYPHMFRHSCAVHLLETTDNVVLVKEHLGHSNLSTTQGYVEVKDLKMKETIKKIDW